MKNVLAKMISLFVLLVCSCSTSKEKQQIRQIRLGSEMSDGVVKKYKYYINKENKKVLHGERITYINNKKQYVEFFSHGKFLGVRGNYQSVNNFEPRTQKD